MYNQIDHILADKKWHSNIETPKITCSKFYIHFCCLGHSKNPSKSEAWCNIS